MTAFPDLQVLLDRVALETGHADYHWTLTGTNTGSGGGGKRVHIHGVERWKFGADGLIAESLGEFDAAEYQRQLSAG